MSIELMDQPKEAPAWPNMKSFKANEDNHFIKLKYTKYF